VHSASPVGMEEGSWSQATSYVFAVRAVHPPAERTAAGIAG
jgi:hypothetical protein